MRLLQKRPIDGFPFDAVFGPEAIGPETLYPYWVHPLVEGTFQGISATVLAYGQTGSGKSYTMGMDIDGPLAAAGGPDGQASRRLKAAAHKGKQKAAAARPEGRSDVELLSKAPHQAPSTAVGSLDSPFEDTQSRSEAGSEYGGVHEGSEMAFADAAPTKPAITQQAFRSIFDQVEMLQQSGKGEVGRSLCADV